MTIEMMASILGLSLEEVREGLQKARDTRDIGERRHICTNAQVGDTLHGHKCSCGMEWEHTNHAAFCDACHTCPSCGAFDDSTHIRINSGRKVEAIKDARGTLGFTTLSS